MLKPILALGTAKAKAFLKTTLSLTCGIILGLQMGMNLAEPTEII